jgi:hypothetical protein
MTMTDWLYEASNAQARFEDCSSRLSRVAGIIAQIESMVAEPGTMTDAQGRTIATVSKSKLRELLAEARAIASGS